MFSFMHEKDTSGASGVPSPKSAESVLQQQPQQQHQGVLLKPIIGLAGHFTSCGTRGTHAHGTYCGHNCGMAELGGHLG